MSKKFKVEETRQLGLFVIANIVMESESDDLAKARGISTLYDDFIESEHTLAVWLACRMGGMVEAITYIRDCVQKLYNTKVVIGSETFECTTNGRFADDDLVHLTKVVDADFEEDAIVNDDEDQFQEVIVEAISDAVRNRSCLPVKVSYSHSYYADEDRGTIYLNISYRKGIK